MRSDDAEVRAASMQIRRGLLATRGARMCPMPGCMVITQDSQEGERKHLAVVHRIGSSEPGSGASS